MEGISANGFDYQQVFEQGCSCKTRHNSAVKCSKPHESPVSFPQFLFSCCSIIVEVFSVFLAMVG
jgi:hypothetical protein